MFQVLLCQGAITRSSQATYGSVPLENVSLEGLGDKMARIIQPRKQIWSILRVHDQGSTAQYGVTNCVTRQQDRMLGGGVRAAGTSR